MLFSSFVMYASTREAWESMLLACTEATGSIDLEQFIFITDEIGTRFVQIFKQKAVEGVKIRLLVDMVGSYSFYNSPQVQELEKAGVQIKFFNSISPWRIPTFTSWIFRNHKKTLVVDKKISFTGGTGIGFHMADWRDTNARMEGSVSDEIMESFEEMWQQADKLGIISKIRKFRKNIKKEDFVTNAPFPNKRFLYHTLTDVLRGAKKSIYISTPYLIPDRKFRRILRLASYRGVDVKIIVPQVIDVSIVESASHSLYAELLRSGIRIFKYQPAMLHAKTAVVDDDWATFGSFNLDNLSFLYNYEANVVTTNAYVIQKLKEDFGEDLASSREVTYTMWKKRSAVEKIREFLAGFIRRFL